MKNLSITGKFLGAGAIKEVGEKKTKVRSFWVDITDGEYANTPEFNLVNDKVALVESIAKGQEIEVTFNLRGNKYKNKEGKEGIITNLQAWRIDVVKRESAATANIPTNVGNPNASDDLPF